jgi:endonuclease/exonuclease/phosphatase (EEP) superfamily protein YafD
MIAPLTVRATDTQPVARRRLWWIFYVSVWAIAAALLMVAILRMFYHDGAFPLIWLNAFTTYVYLPAYACLAYAMWRRRWLLMLASSVVVGCHLVWLAPDFLRDRRFDVVSTASTTAMDDDSTRTVKIFFANVAEHNTEYEAMLGEIADANPDVIILVEYGWGWHRAFKTAPVMAPYVHGSGHLQSHIGSVNVFSRLPLKSEMQNWVNGRAMHTIAVDVGDQALRIVGLHAPRPIDSPRYDYRGYWQQMVPLLTAEQGPRVVVGDLNIAQHSVVYEQLTRHALQSAHEAVGRGYATTWPNGRYWLPPIRIDHAFVSPEVECISIAEGRGLGSDHRPLVVEVRVRNRRSAGGGGRHNQAGNR